MRFCLRGLLLAVGWVFEDEVDDWDHFVVAVEKLHRVVFRP